MAYISYNDLIMRYPLIANWNAGEAEVNSDLIYYAEMMVNSMLGSHFSVPFGAAHPTVKDLTLDMAYYKGMMTKDPDTAKKIQEAVMGRIDRIKAGAEYIYTGSGTTIAPSGCGQDVWSTVQDYHPVHSMLDAEHEETQVDPDRIDDLEDERND